MKIFTIPAGVLRANSYIVTEDGKSAVLIDCGGKEPLAFAEQKGIKIEYVLLTHGHFDHIGGCAALQAAGAKIGCLAGEEKLVGSPADLSAAMGIPVEPFRLDFTFRDGEVLDLCGMRFSVIATPGHTKGGCCFLCGAPISPAEARRSFAKACRRSLRSKGIKRCTPVTTSRRPFRTSANLIPLHNSSRIFRRAVSCEMPRI